MSANIGANLRLDGEREFKAALKESSDSLKVLGSELKLAAAEFEGQEKSVEALTRTQDILGRSVDEQKDKVKLLEERLREASAAFGDTDSRTRALQTQLNNASAELVKTQRELDGVTADLKEAESGEKGAGDAAEEAGKQAKEGGENAEKSGRGWAALGDVCRGVGEICAEIGRALVAATKEVVDFVGDCVQVGMSFDSSMAQVAATMGTTVDEIGELRDFALEMGSATSFSASQAADALNYMALAGYDAETSMEMLPTVLNLAAAGGMELAAASDMVTDASSALGLSIEETAELVDKMAKASSKSNTSVEQLGDAILKIGGSAKDLSGGTTELAAALGILADNGIKGSEGGTHLRNILMSLNPTTNAAADAFDKLSLNAYDAEGAMRPLEDIFAELAEKTADMTDQERTDILGAMFNKTDIASVNALLSTTTARWHVLTAEIDSASYSMDDMRAAVDSSSIAWEKYADTAWGAKNLAAEMFDEIAWNLKNNRLSIEELQDYLQSEYDLDFEDAVTAIEEVQNALDNATGAAQAMANTQLDNLAGDITLFKSALEGAQITISDQVTPTLRQFVQFGTDAVSKLTEGFRDGGFEGFNEALKEVLTEGLSMIAEFAVPFMEAVGTVVEALGKAVLDNIDPIIETGAEVVQALVDGLFNALPQIIDAAVTLILTLAKGLIDNLPTIVEGGIQLIVAVVQGIAEALPELIPAAVDAVLTIVDALLDNLDLLIDAAIELIMALADGLIQALPRLLERAPEIIAKLVGALIDNLPKIIAMGPDLIMALVTGIIDALPQLLGAAAEIVGQIVSGILNGLSSLWEAGKEALTSIWEGLTSLDPLQWGKDLISNFIGGIKEGWNNLKDGVKSVAQGIKDFLGFSEPKEGPLSDFHTYAPDMIDLFITGLQQGQRRLQDQLADTFDPTGLVDGAIDFRAGLVQARASTVSLDAASLSALQGAGRARETVVTINFTGSLAQLGRLLQPEIQTATRLRGPSLVG